MNAIRINYFDIINSVIQSICDNNGIILENENTLSNIHICFKKMLRGYQERLPDIDYRDPLNQIAYLCSFVPIYADLVRYILENDIFLKNYFDKLKNEKEQINVCILGGGPGTEILGFARWLDKLSLEHTTAIKFTFMGPIKEWDFCCLSLREQIELRFTNVDSIQNLYNIPLIIPSISFSSLNITDDSFKHSEEGFYRDSDIYILSNVFSEFFLDREKLKQFKVLFSDIIMKARAGARFLFIDVTKQTITSDLTDLLDEIGLSHNQVMYPKCQSNSPSFRNSHRNFILNEENKNFEDLGVIWAFMRNNNWNPKEFAHVFWVVGCKN